VLSSARSSSAGSSGSIQLKSTFLNLIGQSAARWECSLRIERNARDGAVDVGDGRGDGAAIDCGGRCVGRSIQQCADGCRSGGGIIGLDCRDRPPSRRIGSDHRASSARELGFTLNEIRTLLSLSVRGGPGACTDVRELAESHLAEVRGKIADLRAMETVLADAVRRCAAGEMPGCPIIDALSAA
jgi:hypothetical protein